MSLAWRNSGMDTPNISLTNIRTIAFHLRSLRHAVWLYHRFCLSFRDVEELLAERGVSVSYEAVRQWCLKFGQAFARKLRQGQQGDTWYLDEVVITIGGERHYLWRAVDQGGEVLDILVHYRLLRARAFATWHEVTCAQSAA